MGDDSLTRAELAALVQRVFRPGPDDHALALLIDLPDQQLPDNPAWRQRRLTAATWSRDLIGSYSTLGLSVGLFAYRNVRSSNADLPTTCWPVDPAAAPGDARDLERAATVELERVLASHRLVLAPTEMSATAPLKVLAPKLGFRAATMPRFSPAMIPALRIDYQEVDRRVRRLAALLDQAAAADLRFVVDGRLRHDLHLDLRHRSAHASGGLLHAPGTAGNLPSGEAYIVPYEGERSGDPSGSSGTLPVEHDGEVVLLRIAANRAQAVVSDGPASRRKARLLAEEPARGNLAELGLGVLADFGIEPIGEVLLDEKLGLHLALGRSEHFGGQVGPPQFSSPERVVHEDHVYLPSLQPRVRASSVELTLEDGTEVALMRDGRYVVSFDDPAS